MRRHPGIARQQAQCAIAVLLAGSILAGPAGAYVLLDGKWHDPALPVPWRLNTFQNEPSVPGTDEFTDLRQGFTNWQAVTGAKIAFLEGPAVTTANPCAITLDFQNVVSFRDCGNHCTGNCIGVTSSSYDLGADYIVGGLSALRRLDSDIVFGRQWTWITLPSAQQQGCSGRMIVQSIATHEIGHLIGLGHTPVIGATMFASTSTCDQSLASLAPDDVLGTTALYDETIPVYQIGTHDVNQVRLGVTNCGNVGLPASAAAGNGATGIGGGAGFQFPAGTNHLFEGSFIIGREGAADTAVSDDFRWQDNENSLPQDADFVPRTNLTLLTPGVLSDQESVSEFDDSAANRLGVRMTAGATPPLGVRVRLESYAWNDPGHDKYVILRYRITNTTASALNGVLPGLIFDWDFTAVNYSTNGVGYDGTNRLGYVSDPSTANRAGVRVLNAQGVRSFRALTESGTGADVHTNTTKHQWLISGFAQTALANRDVGTLICTGPFDIPAGGTAVAAFVMCAGTSLADLRAVSQAAQAKYDQVLAGGTAVEETAGVIGPVYALGQNAPNPFNPATRITYTVPRAGAVTLKVYNLAGRLVRTLAEGARAAGGHEAIWDGRDDGGQAVASGTYCYELRANGELIQSRKMQLVK